jgi:hypothetical protein
MRLLRLLCSCGAVSLEVRRLVWYLEVVLVVRLVVFLVVLLVVDREEPHFLCQ